jgi:hypothetical protein
VYLAEGNAACELAGKVDGTERITFAGDFRRVITQLDAVEGSGEPQQASVPSFAILRRQPIGASATK